MVQGQLKRLTDDIEEMLLLGRPAHPNPRATDVAAVARTVAESFRRSPGDDDAAIELRGAASLPLNSDPDAIRIILERLLRNAVQHTTLPHAVELEVAATADGATTVSVRDQGNGIAPELLEKVFLPFFPQHRGRPGLGLAVAAKLAHALGGSIEIESEQGVGTTARLMLPPTAPAAEP
jgi:signal transduction histidine kinase